MASALPRTWRRRCSADPFCRRKPSRQAREIADAGLLRIAAQQRARILDQQRHSAVGDGQRECFWHEHVRLDALRSQHVDPAAQRGARDDRDTDRVAGDLRRQCDVQVLDRAGEALLDRVRQCPGQLRALLRYRGRAQQQDLFGRHEDRDVRAARERLRGWRARVGRGKRAPGRVLREPGQRAIGEQAQQQAIGHRVATKQR